MTGDSRFVPGPTEDQDADRRERFVLRGGAYDVADPVLADPDPIDLEEILRRLEDPERSRTRARRHSTL